MRGLPVQPGLDNYSDNPGGAALPHRARGNHVDVPCARSSRRHAAAQSNGEVRAADGTRLHTEVFGPRDGYPIVLAHGITCAIRVWAYQIADLATDYRVIAFDHRGHGRSGVPRRGGYSLDHLASDLDAVLEATLAPARARRDRRALDGRHRHQRVVRPLPRTRSAQRADAVALINTTTGDLLRKVKLLTVPRQFSPARVRGRGAALINAFGGVPGPARGRVAEPPVGRHAGGRRRRRPGVADFIYELFARHRPPAAAAARGCSSTRWGRGTFSLDGLTVPTLVIGSERDRLTADQPVAQDRRRRAQPRRPRRAARRPLLDAGTPRTRSTASCGRSSNR